MISLGKLYPLSLPKLLGFSLRTALKSGHFLRQQYFPDEREQLGTRVEERTGFQLLVLLLEVGVVVGE